MINSFNYKSIPDYPTIVLQGKRRSGKGVLTRDLVKNHFSKKKLRNAYLFSPTANIAQNPLNFIPEKNRYLELDIEIIEMLMKNQEALIKEDPKGNYHILIVIDDMVGSINNKHKFLLNKIFIMGRHLQISLIYSIQECKNSFTPCCRQNADIIFIFNQSNYFNKEQLAFEYLSVSMNKKDGIDFIDNYAVGHQSLVILNTNKSGKIQDYLFKHTADYPITDFLLKFS